MLIGVWSLGREKTWLACVSSRVQGCSCSKQLSLKKDLFISHLLGHGLLHAWKVEDIYADGKCPYLSPWDGWIGSNFTLNLDFSKFFSLATKYPFSCFSCITNPCILHSPALLKGAGKNKEKLISNAGGQSTQLAGKQKSGRTALERQFRYRDVLMGGSQEAGGFWTSVLWREAGLSFITV